MEKFMESKFMQAFMIVAAKIGAQKHLVAIRDGFVAIMPVVMAGSLIVVVNNLPINKNGDGLRTILDNNKVTNEIVVMNGNVWYGTLATLSLFLVVGVGYALARGYEQDAIASGIVALSVFCSVLPQSTSGGFVTTDTTLANAIVAQHEAQKAPGATESIIKSTVDGVPVFYKIAEEMGPQETVDTTKAEQIVAYAVTPVADEQGTLPKDESGADINQTEKITVTYTNVYETNADGSTKVGPNGERTITSTSRAYSYQKETGSWGNINVGIINSNGLFVAMLIGLMSAEIFSRLAMSGKITIKMPETVPPAVAKSFASLLPGIITILGGEFIIQMIVKMASKPTGTSDFFGLVSKVISEPIKNISESYGAALAVGMLTTFLWFFGLHGANIVGAVFEPISLGKLAENTENINNGREATNIVTTGFFNTYIWMGGSGCTLALLFAIYLGSKSKAQRAVASLAIVPGIFEINEPVIFGLPIVLNAAYFIPFLLVPFVLVTVTYTLTKIGFCPIVSVLAPWTLPPIISGFIATSNFMACVVQIINLAIATVIYFPFVKIADKMEERAQQA